MINRHLCPLECGWHHDELDITGGDLPLGAPPEFNMDGYVRQVMTRRVMRVEKILREHCESHTVEEWATSLLATRQERDALAAELAAEQTRAKAVRDWMDQLSTLD